MERIATRQVYDGRVVTVRIDEFRFEDGSTSEREIVTHAEVAAVVAHDDAHVFLVRQPREAVAEEALLEIPAGKVDPGETPLACAKRELAEEIGLEANSWSELKRFYTTPGFAEETVHLFRATDLVQSDVEPDPAERIEVVRHPLSDLGAAIEACPDSKSLIGLLLLRELMA